MRCCLRFLTDLILYVSAIAYWPYVCEVCALLWLTCIFSFPVFLKSFEMPLLDDQPG